MHKDLIIAALWSISPFGEAKVGIPYGMYQGVNEYIDKRGKISNYSLTEPINLIGYIESKAGTVRANHYHPIQEQKCLVTKGQFISIYQDLLNKNSPKITHVVDEGQLIVTKPNTAHAMVFPKDTVFLNLVRGEREHDNYGVTHTIRHVLVDDNEKDLLLSCYKFDCRSCGNNNRGDACTTFDSITACLGAAGFRFTDFRINHRTVHAVVARL